MKRKLFGVFNHPPSAKEGKICDRERGRAFITGNSTASPADGLEEQRADLSAHPTASDTGLTTEQLQTVLHQQNLTLQVDKNNKENWKTDMKMDNFSVSL